MRGVSERGKLCREMAAILLVAAVLGVAWNRTLLHNAWTGGAPAVTLAGESPLVTAKVPLPLGLMQVKELYDRKEAIIVDARDAGAFAAGHIKGALSLPVGEVAARLPRFQRDVPATATLVVYCNGYGCHDSMELGKKLLEAGCRTVYVFEGGFPEWGGAGYPTAKGER
jgi:rhodanese-related sulfurtransferase